MPLRSYMCLNCEFQNDELIRSSADEPTKCPSCGSEQYERQVSGFGGYQGNLGGSSTRPKNAGSFRRVK